MTKKTRFIYNSCEFTDHVPHIGLIAKWLCLRKLCPPYQACIWEPMGHAWQSSPVTDSQPSNHTPASWLNTMGEYWKGFPHGHGSGELAGGLLIFHCQLAPQSSLTLRGIAMHTVFKPSELLIAPELYTDRHSPSYAGWTLPSRITVSHTSSSMSGNRDGATGIAPE